ncbi:MAG TPA: OmpA family protein [Candidatus Saccharimonadia bacterium]|nr:OmpA family protein [Candidatus Saccharimonadia bacterium]
MTPAIAVVVAVLLLAACGSAPKRDLDLERIEAELARISGDPELGPLAPAELARARDATAALRTAEGNEARRAHLAYIAERRVDIAYVSAQATAEERRLAELEREHDRIMLEATRRDAESARLEAEKQRLQNLARAEELERARADMASAIVLSQESALEAESARAREVQSRRVAEAQQQEAELAKRETELALAAADSLRIQMSNLSAQREQRGEVMTLGEAVFSPGQSSLQPEALEHLGGLVEFVQADPARRVRIEGHTDDRGGANLNQVLSQRRAEAVRDALVARGVDAARIVALGRGETVPLATNDTPAGRARNRRVEVILER